MRSIVRRSFSLLFSQSRWLILVVGKHIYGISEIDGMLIVLGDGGEIVVPLVFVILVLVIGLIR